MHCQFKMRENGGEIIFISKETTNKVKITFLPVINEKICVLGVI